MSSSDKNAPRASALKTAYVYLLISLFCVLFGGVYELYSHEIYSNYMIYAFLFPLMGGTLVFLSLLVFRLRLPKRLSQNLYHAGIAALTVGCILEGVVEIYGTTNDLIRIYFIVGTALVAAGVIAYVAGCVRDQKKREVGAVPEKSEQSR